MSFGCCVGVFMLDPQYFCVNLDFENDVKIVKLILLFNSIKVIQRIMSSAEWKKFFLK